MHLCRHVPGRASDLLLLRATGVMRRIPKEGVVVRVDKGYEGIEEEYPEVRVQKPKKARRGHPLTVLEKIYNRAMSTLRMPVEHAIGHLKKFPPVQNLVTAVVRLLRLPRPKAHPTLR